jgi:hypothetical protein
MGLSRRSKKGERAIVEETEGPIQQTLESERVKKPNPYGRSNTFLPFLGNSALLDSKFHGTLTIFFCLTTLGVLNLPSAVR